ncbi:hypothetical protein [Spirochaeta dissipatitropha]
MTSHSWERPKIPHRLCVLITVMFCVISVPLFAEDTDFKVLEGNYIDFGLGFPTYLQIGEYMDLSSSLPYGIMSGIDFSIGIGSDLGGAVRLAKNNPTIPEAWDAGSTWLGLLQIYMTAFILEPGDFLIPLKTGMRLAYGRTFGNTNYGYQAGHFEFLYKAELAMPNVPLLVPYLELGYGGGFLMTYQTAGTPEVAAEWDYHSIAANLGVRFFYSALGGKSEPIVESKPEPVSVPEPEPEPLIIESDLQLPKWWMDMPALQYNVSLNPLDGAIVLHARGPLLFQRSYQFQHMSTISNNRFNRRYGEADVVEVIEVNEDLWHVRLQSSDSGVIEYKIHRLAPGEERQIDGQRVKSERGGVYFDGMIFEPQGSESL